MQRQKRNAFNGLSSYPQAQTGKTHQNVPYVHFVFANGNARPYKGTSITKRDRDKQMTTYYTMYIKEPDGLWFVQFGDYVRKVVTDEKRDSYRGLKGHIWKCDHLPTTAECEAYAADNLNGKL